VTSLTKGHIEKQIFQTSNRNTKSKDCQIRNNPIRPLTKRYAKNATSSEAVINIRVLVHRVENLVTTTYRNLSLLLARSSGIMRIIRD